MVIIHSLFCFGAFVFFFFFSSRRRHTRSDRDWSSDVCSSDLPAFVPFFSKKCHMYKKGTKAGEYEEVDVPPEYRARFEQYSKELIERIAETDDTLLERYLGGEEIGRDEAIAAMKAGMAKGELFPLFCGAAELTDGMRALLNK